jgi:D-alanyl-D-alanine carboxypeptidase
VGKPGGVTHSKQARTTTHPIRIRRNRVAGVLVLIVAIAASLAYQLLPSSSSTAAPPSELARIEDRAAGGVAVPGTAWPEYGQAAVRIGQSRIQAGPNQHAAPIASVAKVMTAYLVLRDHPLGVGEDGPTITLTDADVADTDRRSRQRESVVPIVAGEQLTDGRHCKRCCCRRRTTSPPSSRGGTPARPRGSSRT